MALKSYALITCAIVALLLAFPLTAQADNGFKVILEKYSICAIDDFPTFFEKFSTDENMQRMCIRTPFSEIYVEDGAEIIPVETFQSYDQIDFPVLPLPEQREEYGLSELKIVSLDSHNAIINLSKPDTCFSLTFTFEKSPFWVLTSVFNQSL